MAASPGVTRVSVALTPEALAPDPAGVCVVVDVIRASTTLVALAGSGDPQVWVAKDIETARKAAARLGAGTVLCGESGGEKPDGFDLGNSPREIADTSLHGRKVVFATTNGSRALHRWSASRRTFVAALRNVGAAARRALEAARGQPEEQTEISIVCAGRSGEVALDDVYTAGEMVRRMLRIRPNVELDESATLAMIVKQAYRTPYEALKVSRSARMLEPLGLQEDVRFCAELDASIVVPELGNGGSLRIVPDGL